MKGLNLALLCLLFAGSMACNKEAQAFLEQEPTQTHHGYTYIACAIAPYYLKMDSLVAHCSAVGSLPSPLPQLSLLTTDAAPYHCALDNHGAQLGNVDQYDFQINYAPYNTITIETNLLGAEVQDLTLVFQDSVYQPGEYPYLGGYRYTTNTAEVSLQMVNAYIGGCIHNVLIWEYSQF